MDAAIRDHYLAEQARLDESLPRDSWLRQARREAMESFAGTGFPTPREESWKYTDLRKLGKQQLPLGVVTTPDASELQAQLPAGLDAHRMTFVNGHYNPALSDIGSLPGGVTLAPLSDQLQKNDDTLREQLNATVNGSRTALTDLNTAFLKDGLYLQLADGVALDKPLLLLFMTTDGCMSHLRNLVSLGHNSEVTLIEQHVAMGEPISLTTAITEVQAGQGARLARCKLQQASVNGYHIGGFYLDQAIDSQARLHGVDLGGGLVRNDIQCRLQGAGADVEMHGVYAPTGRQHVDNHTLVDHQKPQGRSREAYRGVLDGNGRGVFNGRVVVRKDAQKTDSEQSSAALLLSKTAQVNAKPELEIYADDVKCAHGATVGQLDEDAVFYLQSRGVDEAGARSLLTYSFADEIIRRVGNEALYKHIEKHFLQRLPNGESLRDLL